MRSSFIVLLCFGLVRALLQNVTVDDTSPLIIYAEDTFQCNALTCGNETLAAGQFNESLTYTSGPILFNFTGVGYYATIQIFGVAAVSFEGEGVVFNNSDLNPANVRENVWAQGFNDTSHTLVIVPVVTNPSTIVGFESLVYTVSLPDKSSHVGAIVGGVIGGVSLILVLSLAALLARRRKLILRRNQRKSVVLRGLAIARQNQIGQVGSEEGVKDLAS